MKVLFIYNKQFGWTPASKTVDFAEEDTIGPQEFADVQVAFIHAEKEDEERAGNVETKLVKNLKWLARKNATNSIILHSFAHLSESKADPVFTKELFDRVASRLSAVGFQVVQTPYGHFLDLQLNAPGTSLARVFKSI